MAVRLSQGGGGLGAGDAGGQHHDRDRSSVAAGLESAAGGFVSGFGGLLDDADGALGEFFVLGPHVDHEVAVNVAETAHDSGGNHVEAILWAVPAFMRDDPARTSGPTSVTMAKSAARSSGELRLQVRAMVQARRRGAYLTAAMVNGVRPLEAMPRTIS